MAWKVVNSGPRCPGYEKAYNNYILCFRRAVIEVVKNTVTTLHEDLKSTFKDVDSMSLTLDIWSDRQMRGFLGFTAHYTVKGKTALQSTVLAVDRFKGIIQTVSWLPTWNIFYSVGEAVGSTYLSQYISCHRSLHNLALKQAKLTDCIVNRSCCHHSRDKREHTIL